MHLSFRNPGLSIATAVLLASAAHTQVWWPQWALNPQHTGQVSVAGQPMNNILASLVYDPLVPAESAANQGDLLAHYQVPLIDSTTIYMEFKSGTYNKNTYSTEIWGENAFQWQSGKLLQTWSFTSDWEAPGSQADFWEPVFHGVLANGFIYVPGAGGTLFKLDTRTGAVISRINPFGLKIEEFCAEPPGFDTYDRVDVRVLVLVAIEHLQGDRKLLQPVEVIFESSFDESQENGTAGWKIRMAGWQGYG